MSRYVLFAIRAHPFLIYIYIIDTPAYLTLIFTVDLHNLYLFLSIELKLSLVLSYQFGVDLECSHFLRFLHANDHAVQNKKWILYCLQRLKNVTVLLPIQIERVFGIKFLLQLLG